MMQLVSQRKEIERPSDFALACRLLRDVLRQDRDCNYLWTNGRWQPASLDDIMRRANSHLKSVGREQFKGKAAWIV
jgi:hypothetical protein